jgi:nucleoside-diphosphate-sugar epimerase|tara:strand:- start:18489 stop:19358 length:870 start_codon:yes stop_codon:yes gene_type:complete
MKTILIVGINGFLGSHLAKSFKDNFKIIGLTSNTNNLSRIHKEEFEVFSSSDEEIANIFENNTIDIIIYAATQYQSSDNKLFSLFNTNVILPFKLLELSKQYNIKSFINVDTFFNNPKYSYSYLSEYTLSKKHLVDWLKIFSATCSFKVVNMKIFHMYGQSDSSGKFIPSMIDKISNNEPFVNLTKGEQKRDFIYIEDVVEAFRTVVISTSTLDTFQEFEVGTGSSTSIHDLLVIIKCFFNSSTELIFGSLEYRKNEIMVSKANNSELLKLGWVVKHDITQGIKKLIKS